MKTIKNLILALFMAVSLNSFGDVIKLTYDMPKTLSCKVGDSIYCVEYNISIFDSNLVYKTGFYANTYYVISLIDAYAVLEVGIIGYTIKLEVKDTTTINPIDTTITDTTNTTGIYNLEYSKPTIKIFPNPTTDIVNIDTPINSTMSIFNISGQIVFEKPINKGITDINISKLAPGAYFVRVDNNFVRLFKE